MNRISYKTVYRLINALSNNTGSYKKSRFTWRNNKDSIYLFNNNDLCVPIIAFYENKNIILHYSNEFNNWDIKDDENTVALPLSRTVSAALNVLFGLGRSEATISEYDYYKGFLENFIYKKYNGFLNETNKRFDISELKDINNTDYLGYKLNSSSNWIDVKKIPINTRFIHTVLSNENVIKKVYSKQNHLYWQPENFKKIDYMDLKYNNTCIIYYTNLFISNEYYNIEELNSIFKSHVTENDVISYFGY